MGYTLEKIKEKSLEEQVEILMKQFNAIKCCGENCSNNLSNVEYEIFNGKILCKYCFAIEKQKEREAVMHQILKYRRFVKHAEEEIEKLKNKFDIEDSHLEKLIEPIALANEEVHSFSTNTIKEEQPPVNVQRNESSSTQKLKMDEKKENDLKTSQEQDKGPELKKKVQSSQESTNAGGESILRNSASKKSDESVLQNEIHHSLSGSQPKEPLEKEQTGFIMLDKNLNQTNASDFDSIMRNEPRDLFEETGSEDEFTLRNASTGQDNPNKNNSERKPLNFTKAPSF